MDLRVCSQDQICAYARFINKAPELGSNWLHVIWIMLSDKKKKLLVIRLSYILKYL